MNSRLFFCAAFMLISALTAEFAQAQWTQFQRDEFAKGCVPACQNQGNQRPACEAYCACVVQEGERRYSSADYERLERDARDKVDSPILREFATLYPICQIRVFGQPANKDPLRPQPPHR